MYDGPSRVVIENVQPAVNGGQYPAKRSLGQLVQVEADILSDGHDLVAGTLMYRSDQATPWSSVQLQPQLNDRWTAQFSVNRLGRYTFKVAGLVDRFGTWKRDLKKRIGAGQDITIDLQIGADLVKQGATTADEPTRQRLALFESLFRSAPSPTEILATLNGDEEQELNDLMLSLALRGSNVSYSAEYEIFVDPPKASFSAWYELFPRSAANESRHGTLKDVEARLPYVAAMGFDVLYLPPIHPIGRSHRKGPNNSVTAKPDDVGSPWAIGSAEGGHKAIHPELGTFEDFHHLVGAAAEQGIELAFDIAFQCSPDHPYVRDHPEWFQKRPDGTIQYAENPPKKYQDIYPFDFECDAWHSLWEELKSIFLFWMDHGVRIFRVDNPHTKPFPFWEWVIDEIHRERQDVIFLAEAFTRPKVMYRLAKVGFTQSYTYFAWRDTKWEITQYFTELTRSEVREFFRPNLWPNTPDILPEPLQIGGRAAYMARLVLAATLVGNYGIYGPPFEHGWSAPREPGSEEYLNSEKYQVHQHDLSRPDSLRDFIARVNRIRRDSPAIAHGGTLEFHTIGNEQLIAYSRTSADKSDVMLVVVNLDPNYRQAGWIELPVDMLALPTDRPYQMHDLLTDARYLWHGNRNYIELDPASCPAHAFRVRRRTRSERDFEYFL